MRRSSFVVLLCIAYLASLPFVTAWKNTTTVPQIVDAAYEYLESHLLTGERWGYPYHFYRPSLTKYCAAQWLWDSGSHMISWSHRNVTNSILDLRTMLQMQHEDGFIPEEIYWAATDIGSRENAWLYYGNDQQTNNTQMPVLAFSLRAIFWASGNDTRLLDEFLPPLVRYWQWWWDRRNAGPHGLVSIIHGWESGLDASPLYDAPYNVTNPMPTMDEMYSKFPELMMSYHFEFNWNQTTILNRSREESWSGLPRDWANWLVVEDVGVNVVYAAGWGILGDLALLQGNRATAARCHDMEQLVTENIIKHCWWNQSNTAQRHDGNTMQPPKVTQRPHLISYFKNERGEWTPIYTETVQSVMGVLLRRAPRDIIDYIVQEQLEDASRFALPYPVPSVALYEPSFNPVYTIDLMWRGPTWAFPTWFVMEGLWSHGYTAQLNHVMDRWIDMVRIGGIYEMYNPLNATPYGQEGLGMSCLIVDWLYRLGRV